MSKMNLYTIESKGTDANGCSLFEITVNRESEIFNGHFPGQPVLPGVCSIEMIRESLSLMAGSDVHLCKILQCKFTGMVNPMQESLLNAVISLKPGSSDGEGEVVAEILSKGRSILKLKGTIANKRGSKKLNYIVLIPTYNNAATLEEVINGVRGVCEDIVVVNDGSTDSTAEILSGRSLAGLKGLTVITHKKNLGKGAALKTGFSFAVESGFDYVLTIDSDGQHFASEIDTLIDAAIREPDTLWVGSRELGCKNMPGKNTFANKFSNFWFRIETGISLEDTQSGFRIYPLRKMGKIKGITGRYEFELETLVRAAWRGIEVKNTPVRVYYPPKEERVSHFKPILDFTRISLLNTLLVLIALLWWWPISFIRWFSRDNLKRFIKRYITESEESNGKIAKSVGLGLFFGISPLWGYQMITAVAAAHLLKLNKVIVLVSSNISIPPMIPFILYGSFAAGALILREPLSFIPSSLSLSSISDSLVQYLTGSIAFATIAGLAGWLISFILLKLFRKRR
jgi:glycosyltransferase involved in cell wall biosynthesis/3-hydroxymyristoyl/3-hydroxydecanoyl-(acyl carrier protein) dehydratase